jgi:hypothetical protein
MEQPFPAVRIEKKTYQGKHQRFWVSKRILCGTLGWVVEQAKNPVQIFLPQRLWIFFFGVFLKRCLLLSHFRFLKKNFFLAHSFEAYHYSTCILVTQKTISWIWPLSFFEQSFYSPTFRPLKFYFPDSQIAKAGKEFELLKAFQWTQTFHWFTTELKTSWFTTEPKTSHWFTTVTMSHRAGSLIIINMPFIFSETRKSGRNR